MEPFRNVSTGCSLGFPDIVQINRRCPVILAELALPGKVSVSPGGKLLCSMVSIELATLAASVRDRAS